LCCSGAAGTRRRLDSGGWRDDDAKCGLVDLADAYGPVLDRNAFDCALRDLMAPYGQRLALVRRPVEAGLWRQSAAIDVMPRP
jgi:hypothetical protein